MISDFKVHGKKTVDTDSETIVPKQLGLKFIITYRMNQ